MPKYEGLVYRNIAVDAMCDIAIEERDRYKQAVEERKNDACKLVGEVVEQLNSLKGQIKADNYTHFKDEIWCNPVCFRISTYLHKGPRTRINAGFFEKPASRIYM